MYELCTTTLCDLCCVSLSCANHESGVTTMSYVSKVSCDINVSYKGI